VIPPAIVDDILTQASASIGGAETNVLQIAEMTDKYWADVEAGLTLDAIFAGLKIEPSESKLLNSYLNGLAKMAAEKTGFADGIVSIISRKTKFNFFIIKVSGLCLLRALQILQALCK
jgi:hypothetical protein